MSTQDHTNQSIVEGSTHSVPLTTTHIVLSQATDPTSNTDLCLTWCDVIGVHCTVHWHGSVHVDHPGSDRATHRDMAYHRDKECRERRERVCVRILVMRKRECVGSLLDMPSPHQGTYRALPSAGHCPCCWSTRPRRTLRWHPFPTSSAH